jgi:hypothetical protein
MQARILRQIAYAETWHGYGIVYIYKIFQDSKQFSWSNILRSENVVNFTSNSLY